HVSLPEVPTLPSLPFEFLNLPIIRKSTLEEEEYPFSFDEEYPFTFDEEYPFAFDEEYPFAFDDYVPEERLEIFPFKSDIQQQKKSVKNKELERIINLESEDVQEQIISFKVKEKPEHVYTEFQAPSEKYTQFPDSSEAYVPPGPLSIEDRHKALVPFCTAQGYLDLVKRLKRLIGKNNGRPLTTLVVDLVCAINFCQYGIGSSAVIRNLPPPPSKLQIKAAEIVLLDSVSRQPPDSWPGISFPELENYQRSTSSD
ncbi:unnamed protein product, partial [Meganyctiphanes norvegica]